MTGNENYLINEIKKFRNSARGEDIPIRSNSDLNYLTIDSGDAKLFPSVSYPSPINPLNIEDEE